MNSDVPLVLLTGGTGYIGGQLSPLLEQRGLRLRCPLAKPCLCAKNAGSRREVQCPQKIGLGRSLQLAPTYE